VGAWRPGTCRTSKPQVLNWSVRGIFEAVNVTHAVERRGTSMDSGNQLCVPWDPVVPHVWMAPGVQGLGSDEQEVVALRSCVRPVGAA